MSKISVEKKKGKYTIINKLAYPEAVNERVYTAIASGMFDGFLPMTIRQKRKETRLECVVQEMIPLTQYFAGIVTKRAFLDVVHEIALIIKTCEKNMINPNNLDLRSDRIFVDPETKCVRCIYWPVVNNERSEPPQYFLKQLDDGLAFNTHEDREYLVAYNQFFNGLNPFSVNAFDRLVMSLAGKKATSSHSAPSEALTGALRSGSQTENKSAAPSRVNIEYDPFAQHSEPEPQQERRPPEERPAPQAAPVKSGGRRFCGGCGAEVTGEMRFCNFCGTKLAETAAPAPEPERSYTYEPEPEYHSGTTVLGAEEGTTILEEETGGTTVLGYDEPEEPIYPTLLRLKTEEIITVDKPNFLIGAERSCELCITDNTFISRRHAEIITRDDRYYIMDRGSTNKTYVDGKKLIPETEVEIFPGTTIRLANEDFSFNLES